MRNETVTSRNVSSVICHQWLFESRAGSTTLRVVALWSELLRKRQHAKRRIATREGSGSSDDDPHATGCHLCLQPRGPSRLTRRTEPPFFGVSRTSRRREVSTLSRRPFLWRERRKRAKYNESGSAREGERERDGDAPPRFWRMILQSRKKCDRLAV